MNAKKAYSIPIPIVNSIINAPGNEPVGVLIAAGRNNKIIINNGTAKTILDIANASMEAVLSPKLNLFLIIFSK